MNSESRKELLNTAQVAEWLNVKESTIRKWTHYGFIPHVKLGRCVRFQESEIEQWLRERAEKGRSSMTPDINWQ
ncbi:MAG: helix-turn-helix domain-containing protein [Pseudomonadota bacterium]